MLRLDGEEHNLLAAVSPQALSVIFNELPPAEWRVVMVIPQDSPGRHREFDKYRRYYEDEADFNLHKEAQEIAVARLEALQGGGG